MQAFVSIQCLLPLSPHDNGLCAGASLALHSVVCCNRVLSRSGCREPAVTDCNPIAGYFVNPATGEWIRGYSSSPFTQ
ncbi:hypothetical protein SCFA_720002 [anaerobic digester metagenome]|uniref:Uncharacterized protein n=1 Tax=anaerobic digester metagenome TaxID=1263854 RepID=A0A485M3Q2_9ZZZZ